MDEIISNIRELIAGGKIEEVFPILKKELQNTDNLNKILLQESRLSEIREDEISGTISSSESHLLNNQVTKAVLEIISYWEKELKGIKADPINSQANLVDKNLVNDVASGYKNDIRFYFKIALLPVIISLIFTIFTLFQNQTMETFQALASTLIASLSAFPVREIINRREKVSILNVLIKKIKMLETNPIEKEIERVNEVFWDLLNNTLGTRAKE